MADLGGSCPTIYGPVTSRRHGRSLGINVGNARDKICTWGCVYCQCGMGSRGRPSDVPTAEEILRQAREAILKERALDSVTFAGNSEPMAHPDFERIVRGILEIRRESGGKWVFNCLSNGSELDDPAKLRAAELLDEAWIKLDCGEDDLYRRLDRPLPELGGVTEQIARIRRLKAPRIQTLLWKHRSDGRLGNHTPANLDSLLAAYARIQPAEIHLYTVAREPAVSGIIPISSDELESFAERVRAAGLRVSAYP